MSNDEKRNADAFNSMLKAKYFALANQMVYHNFREPTGFILPLREGAKEDEAAEYYAMCLFYKGVQFGLELESETPDSIQYMKCGG